MTSPRILVVDDEADLRELLEITLLKMGLDVDSAATLREARALLVDDNDYALVLTDMRLPDGLGLELVREVAAAPQDADRRHHRLRQRRQCGGGAQGRRLRLRLQAGGARRAARDGALGAETVEAAPAAPARAAGAGSRLIGDSQAMQSLRAQIARLARSMAPIAITGESGSGKELAAREIHAQSSRAASLSSPSTAARFPKT